MMTTDRSANRLRRFRSGAALLGLGLALGACTHTGTPAVDATASIPDDYRQRHPIAIQEADKTVNILVGNGRGGLTGPQRAEINSLAQDWMREGTGRIVIDVPTRTPNARAAADSLREIRALLAANGLPGNAVAVRDYQPSNPRLLAAIRVNYPRMTASVGPCGLWPDDLGPSIHNSGYIDNKPYYNFGCAAQRNLAAMVENPADLVQPRAETPAYTARRTASFDKYRKGTSTATTYPESDKAKLSETGK
jgi:pilus assembly protein CpaD